tara:strand:- start:138 stop:2525 length:2388 start_codon:yes stop_codon:yes gene_type:complete
MALSIEERRELNRLEQESLDLESRGLTLENEKLSRLRELRNLRSEELRDQESSVEYQEQILAQINERIKKAKIIQRQGQEVTGIYREQLSVTEKLLDIQEKELDVNAANYETELARIALARDELDIKRKGYNDAEGFAKRFAGITKQPTSEFGKLLVGGGARLEGLASGLADVITPMSVLTSTIDKAVETTVFLAIEQDQAVVNFRRATGASGEFDSTIQNLERSLFTAGVSAAEAGQSVQTLFLNVSDFTEMSATQQTQLAETVAVLNELGVNADNTAKNLEFATRALGMTTTEATRLQRELFTFAQDLGVSADKIAQDFQKFGPQIAALGSEGVEAFKQLEMQAKATGLQIDELVNITEQFNKFDTAAQAVGKLNAMLGGPFLNTLEMVNETNPAKRMELLKNAVDKAGLSFDTMDFYQRKAIASSMGLNEQQLALLMRGEFDVGPPPKTAAELAELAKQTAQFNTVAEELTQLGMGLAITFGPAISLFKDFLQLLSPITQYLGALSVALITYVTITRTLIAVEQVRNAVALVTNSRLLAQLSTTYAYTIASAGLAGVIPFVTTALDLMGISANMALGVFGALTAAALYMAYVFFTKAASPGLITIIGLVTTALFAMGIAATAFGFSLAPVLPFVLAFAAAILSVGVGIGIASAGLGYMVSSLGEFGTGLADSMTATALAIAEIVQSINELNTVKAITFTAAMGPLAAVAMSPVGLAATAVAAAAGPSPGEAAPAAAGGAAGPPPTININLSIDGSEFATVVNSVEVSRYNKGTQSEMYNSIIGMIEQGFAKG